MPLAAPASVTLASTTSSSPYPTVVPTFTSTTGPRWLVAPLTSSTCACVLGYHIIILLVAASYTATAPVASLLAAPTTRTSAPSGLLVVHGPSVLVALVHVVTTVHRTTVAVVIVEVVVLLGSTVVAASTCTAIDNKILGITYSSIVTDSRVSSGTTV